MESLSSFYFFFFFFFEAQSCLKQFRSEDKDVLNAALTGAIAMHLDDELDYLIPRMKGLPGINFQTDWKMIIIQIGSKH